MNHGIVRREAAECLDNAALMLYRAKGKLERLGETSQASRLGATLTEVRTFRDVLLQSQDHVNTAPDQ